MTCGRSIVVSTSRCGRDIPGSNPGWRKTPVAKLSQPGPKYTTTFAQINFLLPSHKLIFLCVFLASAALTFRHHAILKFGRKGRIHACLCGSFHKENGLYVVQNKMKWFQNQFSKERLMCSCANDSQQFVCTEHVQVCLRVPSRILSRYPCG